MGVYPVHKLVSVRDDGKRGECMQCGHVDLVWRMQRGKRRMYCVIGVRESHRRNAKRTHGLTAGEARVLTYKASCELCGSPVNLVVDHCHRTGVIRGVLCVKHNNGLGMFDDDPSMLLRAVAYLEGGTLDLQKHADTPGI